MSRRFSTKISTVSCEHHFQGVLILSINLRLILSAHQLLVVCLSLMTNHVKNEPFLIQLTTVLREKYYYLMLTCTTEISMTSCSTPEYVCPMTVFCSSLLILTMGSMTTSKRWCCVCFKDVQCSFKMPSMEQEFLSYSIL